MLSDTREKYAQVAREEATKYLGSIAREAEAAGVACETAYAVNDHPYEAIIKTAYKGC